MLQSYLQLKISFHWQNFGNFLLKYFSDYIMDANRYWTKCLKTVRKVLNQTIKFLVHFLRQLIQVKFFVHSLLNTCRRWDFGCIANSFSFNEEFVPHIEQLFDEDVLIGNGWTVNEALRPLAYSTLADFIHHVRTLLTLPMLSIAVQLFSKNVYDETLPISIQRMSCKVLASIYASQYPERKGHEY